MSSSRRTRRRHQQNSYRRHRTRLESLEKRYALNAAPVNSVPESQTTYTDEPLAFTAFKGNAISISDADAGPNGNTVKSVGRQWFSFSRRARVES